jgi:putative nucleotidyltransferase with HDIG domain
MASVKIQISAKHLKLGMFVAELDRPWLGTPFLFQGFRLRTIEEIEKIQSLCDSVLVDPEKSAKTPLAYTQQPVPNKDLKRQHYDMSASFEDEILVANEIRADTENCLGHVFDDVTSGRMIDLVTVKRTISDTVDGILRNPDAHVSLTQLKEWDNYTAQHSINVCILALAFARHIGLPRHEMEMLGAGALLHDIGKLKTPLDVLNKPDKLTAEEFKIMQSHPVHGRELLENRYGLPHQIADMAFSHHERIAGGGYPRGLTGTQISVWSRMVAIVDVYDAISSDRCYHKGMSPTEALTKMYGWRLKDFDADLLEKFIQCIGIYPVGTLVELTSGEVGIVISVNPASRLKPKIDLILNKNKQPYFPSRVVNLEEFKSSDPSNTYAIKEVLTPGAYNINMREHLAPIQAAKSKLILPQTG